MGTFSIWHILIVAIIALLLFGGKFKLSDMMGDAAKGIKAFKDGLKDEEAAKKDATTTEMPKVDATKTDSHSDGPKA